MVHKLLGSGAAISQLRFRAAVSIQNAVLTVYHSLLGLKNIPLLQEAYRYILADLENSYLVVLPKAESLVIDNPLKNCKYERTFAEIVVIFLLRALSDIGKSNI